MKILTKNILTASLSLIFGIMLFNKSMFAAPPAATVSPTTITSGGTVSIKMYCTVEGNTITDLQLGPSGGITSTGGQDILNINHTCTASDVETGFIQDFPIILIGTNPINAFVTYTEFGSNPGGSPGNSPLSNTFTVNPALPPEGDLAVSLTSSTSPSNEGDPYITTLTLENKGPAIAAVSGASIRVRVSSFQVDGITLTNPDDLAGWTCTPSYNSDYKNAVLDCLYGGSIAAGQKIVFNLSGKVQDCGYIVPPPGSGGTESVDSFSFINSTIFGNNSSDKYVYKDTDTSNDTAKILSKESEWCNATTEKTDSFNSYKQGSSGSSSSSTSTSTKVPSTGDSPLVTSLMIITAGAALAGGSVLAYNKLKK
jgi:hypothetical protein